MKKTLRQSICNYQMPMYMTEILVNNYCPCFLEMSILRENDSYMFSYETGYSKKINYSTLDTLDKLVLIRSLIKINQTTEDWLINAENYLIEPELIYSYENSVYFDEMKILFYPDFKNMSFNMKLNLFMDKIRDSRNQRESEIFEKLKELSNEMELLKMQAFIDKQIKRLRSERESLPV